MPTEQKIITSADESTHLTEQIAELEKLLQKSESLRKKQFFVSACALLCMILVLTVAILNLATYLRNYPKKELMREVFHHARPLLYTSWNIRGDTPRERRILKQTSAELEKTLNAYMPRIRHAMRQSIHSLKRYSRTELRREFNRHLYTSLQIHASSLLQQKKIPSSSGTAEKIRTLNMELAQRITDKVFAALERSASDRMRIRQEINHLKNSRKMSRMKQEPSKLLEERLVTSFLETLQGSGPEATRGPRTEKEGNIHHE